MLSLCFDVIGLR